MTAFGEMRGGAVWATVAGLIAVSGVPDRAAAIAQASVVSTKVRKVLLYDRSETTAHPDWQAVRQSFQRLATRYGFELVTSNVEGYVTASTLSGVDVLVLSQGAGPVTGATGSAGEAAVRNFVEVQGKAVLMLHAAAGARIPCPAQDQENITHASCNFLAQVSTRTFWQHNDDGTSGSIFMDSVCAGAVPPGALPAAPASVPSSYGHGLCNPETRNIFAGLPRRVNGLTDEWWYFRNDPRNQEAYTFNGVVHGRNNVLVSLDESSLTPLNPPMGDHPLVWTRKMGNGLGAYNSMGHGDIFARRDSIVEKLNWRLLRYLARDFVGCTDPAYAEYNPEASVTALTPLDTASPKPANPCVTPVSIHPLKGRTFQGITVTGRADHVVLRFAMPEAGLYRIQITDAHGRQVYSRRARGGGVAFLEIPMTGVAQGFARGSYVLRVGAPRSGITATRVTLN